MNSAVDATLPPPAAAAESPREVTLFAQNRYLGYPHTNCFADGGASLILGQIEEGAISLWKYHLASYHSERIAVFPLQPGMEKPPHTLVWYDIAPKANVLMACVGRSVWLLDLNEPEPGKAPREAYRVREPYRLNTIPAISPDGKRMVLGLHLDALPAPWNLSPEQKPDSRHFALLVDLETSTEKLIIQHDWFANHFQFSPADPEWIGYCHEGATQTISDRVWAWHPRYAPNGVCVYDQATHCRPPHKLCLGHERWSWHDISVIVPAYGESTAEPRGLYQLFPERAGGRMGDAARLISAGERDWHCDVTRDGRWAVVDTTGPHDVPGRGWENAGNISDIVLVDMATGERCFLARSRQHRYHPRHPHPIFSPDGMTIFYNEVEPYEFGPAAGTDSTPALPRNRVMAVANPWASVSPPPPRSP